MSFRLTPLNRCTLNATQGFPTIRMSQLTAKLKFPRAIVLVFVFVLILVLIFVLVLVFVLILILIVLIILVSVFVSFHGTLLPFSPFHKRHECLIFPQETCLMFSAELSFAHLSDNMHIFFIKQQKKYALSLEIITKK